MNIGFYSEVMRCGKTTSAEYLNKNASYNQITLASTFKKMVEILLLDLGLTKEEVHRCIYGDLKETIIPQLGKTPRYLMQTIGTAWGRQLINKDIWIKTATGNLEQDKNYVCDDVRRVNEARYFRNRGFKIVKVANTRVPILEDEETEGELDRVSFDFDYVLENNGTFEELYSNIDKMLEYFKG